MAATSEFTLLLDKATVVEDVLDAEEETTWLDELPD
jgi:hypothetical protein